MSKFQRHFFVCQASRPPMGKPSCGPRGAGDLMAALADALAQRQDLWSKVNVTACACLGNCFDGPSMVVYPEGVWYAGVKLADIPEIVDKHMVGGQVVERLVYKWPT
jgi:(2Fe-2S) ferredoxin